MRLFLRLKGQIMPIFISFRKEIWEEIEDFFLKSLGDAR